MAARGQTKGNNSLFRQCAAVFAVLSGVAACDGAHSKSGPAQSATPTRIAAGSARPALSAAAATSAAVAPSPSLEPMKVVIQDEAMGTSLHFIAYTSPSNDEAATRVA